MIFPGFHFWQVLLFFQNAMGTNALSKPKFLFKTTETFKLSELQYLEARIQADLHNYELSRILVDRATGSTILKVRGLYIDRTSTDTWPSSFRRCDWAVQVLAEATSVESLLQILRTPSKVMSGLDSWSLEYCKFTDSSFDRNPGLKKYSMKSILCAVANAIPSPPCLDSTTTKDQLLVVDAEGLDESSIALGRIVFKGEKSTSDDGLRQRWYKRPFQYSSAINFNVATIAADLVLDYVRTQDSKEAHEIHLWDPTCGSGTVLACGLERGMQVYGCDVNPECVVGAQNNLKSLFGEDILGKKASIQHHDSCNAWSLEWEDPDCIIANLPWGVNSVNYKNEHLRILCAARARVATSKLCLFVTREPIPKMLSDAGFEVLAQARIPPLDLSLPPTKKKDSKNGPVGRKNLCVVTAAVTI